MFAVLGATPAFIALATSHRPAELRGIAAGAALALLLAWGWSYRRKHTGWAIEVLTGATLFALSHAADEPRQVQGFFFSALMFTGLYGGVWQLALRLVLVQGAFFSALSLSIGGALSIVGFTAAGVVVWALGRALEKQQTLEDELRAREARFRSLVTNASDMIVVLGAGNKITWQSPAVLRELGRELKDGELVPGPRLELLHADGTRRECEALVTDLTLDPNVQGIVLNVRDVTDRNRASKALAVAQREVEIAAQIQTALLPRQLSAPGFEVAAVMLPATEVGGDYYDVLPIEQGCFVGIGDVAGHGLNAGLIMLMVQSVVAALVRERPDAMPAELVVVLNEVLHDNVKNRLRKGDHVTFSLFKLTNDGRVVFAGAHEELVVQRAGGTTTMPTPGTWLAAIPDIGPVTVETTLQLQVGDLLLLHTDGITEARNATGEMYGIDRLVARVDSLRGKSPQEIVDALRADVSAWSSERADDVTLLAARYAG